ncbi:MAG: metallophosphoesterase [Terriglobales bacterium]
MSTPFYFVAYGDSRFHDPKDTEAANPTVRQALVQAIAQTSPAFIVFTGDIVYNGYDKDDWKVSDAETAVWREKKIPVYPVLGNHDLHGNENVALANYFERFPDLRNSRYYSLRAGNTLLLALDSSQDETSGPQGQWLTQKLDRLPSDINFVFIVLHHPPYTSSSDMKLFGGGHSARAKDDPFQSKEVNYHYLQVEVERGTVKITMHRLDMTSSKAVWTEPDSVTISLPAAKAAVQNK